MSILIMFFLFKVNATKTPVVQTTAAPATTTTATTTTTTTTTAAPVVDDTFANTTIVFNNPAELNETLKLPIHPFDLAKRPAEVVNDTVVLGGAAKPAAPVKETAKTPGKHSCLLRSNVRNRKI